MGELGGGVMDWGRGLHLRGRKPARSHDTSKLQSAAGMADEEKTLLLSSTSQTHRDTGGAGLSWKRQSPARTCGRYCLTAAALPLALFKRDKSDEVGRTRRGLV